MNVHGVVRSPRRQRSFAASSLREREWDHADGEKQKHEERSSKKMRIDGRVILFLHFCLPPGVMVGVERRFTEKRGRMSRQFS